MAPLSIVRKPYLIQYRMLFCTFCFANRKSAISLSHLAEQCERLILGSLHDLALTGSLIVDAYEVENAVYDYAMEFLLISFTEELCVRAHRIEADKEVAAQEIALAVVEGDNICIIIVLQILAIYLQYLLIVAKHIGHLAYALAIRSRYGAHPCRRFAMRNIGHLNVYYVVCYHVFFRCGKDDVLLTYQRVRALLCWIL